MNLTNRVEHYVSQHNIQAALDYLTYYQALRETSNYRVALAIVLIAQHKYSEALAELKFASVEHDPTGLILLAILEHFSALPPAQLFLQLKIERLRLTPYLDIPRSIHLETLTVCNAACNFCPYPQVARKGHKMPDALLNKILLELQSFPAQIPFYVCPFKLNEPLLEPRLEWLCKSLETTVPQAQLLLFTNGLPLTSQNIEWLAQLKNLSRLQISLNSHQADEYQELMALPFEKTLKKLHLLHQFVEAGIFSAPVWVSKVPDGTVSDLQFKAFISQSFPLFQPYLVGRGNWIGQVDVQPLYEVPQVACDRWFELSIMSTGQVALCCMDGEGDYILGDINQQSLLEVYNSPGYRKLRVSVRSRVEAGSPCASCAF